MAEQGNNAAMREACQKVRDLLLLRGDGKQQCVLTWDEFNESQKMLRDALATPPRNCDMGTAEEQIKRIRRLCKKYRDEIGKCKGCPVHGVFPKDCALIWAQMPYEEGDDHA